MFSATKRISAIYSNVEGLSPSAAVTINGHNIGKVQSINFKGDGSGLLTVSMLINENFDFSVNSIAQLYEAGLIGGKAIAIIPAFDGAAVVQSGDVLESDVEPGLTDLVNQRLTPLQEKMEAMMVSSDLLLNNLNDVFDNKTKDNIKLSIAEFSSSLASFKATSESLNEVLEVNEPAIEETISNFNKVSQDLTSVSNALSTADLESIIKDLKSTLSSFDSLLGRIDNGEGTIGKLMKDDGV